MTVPAGGLPLLPAVDRAAFAVALAGRLRERGVAVGLTSVEDFTRALEAVPPSSREALYWTARICLAREHGDLAVFDAVFDAVFGDAVLPLDPNARRTGLGAAPTADDGYASVPGPSQESQEGGGLPWVTLPPAVAGAGTSDGAEKLAVPERLPSDLAGLADTPFGELSPRDTALLGQWLERALPVWPVRRSRRHRVRPGGPLVELRATVARARRTGWEPVKLVRTGPVTRPRRVVVLCDVSQSMQPQAVAYLHLMRALALTTDAEVFAFATTVTRLTTVLAHRSAEAAVAAASARVVDRFGGTRIAGSLRTLLGSHHGGLLRGAVVIIGSDGWDGDPPEQLAAAMARLRRRAHTVVWLNPRAGAPGFLPRTGTMAAALPYCDALLPGDTFGSLLRLPAEIAARAARGPRARG
ncbi:VWA domain-containing protein [Streptomyces sp. NBC_01476]|uniref:vWA domain-containing protein n=1 Tax=Streptomyces sp. NBC_01476 TaxID=2903881 RepID=UPI002E32FAD6|nr:VWA domain-containing protein [Streptomyces sp. NBC_01476]